LSFPDIVC